MMHRPKDPGRRGIILPFAAFCLVALLGLVAFAIDVGVLTVARTQAQAAADAAALTAARTLIGDPAANYNLSAAQSNGQAAAAENMVMGTLITIANVTMTPGSYAYDQSAEHFEVQLNQTPYNLMQASVSVTRGTYFARVLNISSFDMSATAVAAHRPRDLTLILDFSGSMNNESDLWNNEGYLGSENNSANNTETIVPRFGHYSTEQNSYTGAVKTNINTNAAMICTSTDARVGKCNVTLPILGVPPMVSDFYKSAKGAAPAVTAFTTRPDSQATTPLGDTYLPVYGTSTNPPTYAKTQQEITNGAAFNGYTNPPYTGYTGPAVTEFAGYTEGPRYWGKTFWIWPPDPRPANDWRQNFFLKSGGSHPTYGGPVTLTSTLYDTSGNWRPPVSGGTTNYIINYQAILLWIKTVGPTGFVHPFPPILRGGRILYYDAIPDDVPQSAYTWTNANSQITDANQRFWKEYIDFTLGVWRDPFGNIRAPGSPSCSYGPDFSWGTVSTPSGANTATGNPKRPRNHFWFGPMTMVQFISDTGLLPGTGHDISMYPAKLGIYQAMEDIKLNHPNDLVSLILFNRPRFNGEPPEAGRFSKAQMSLTNDYPALEAVLFYPPNSTATDARPWDVNGLQTPRSYADYTANTCSNYGFMVAYNQFSGDSGLQGQGLGGLGRRGAQRIIIFETDGMANVAANATFVNNGADSKYLIGPSDSVTPGGSASTAVYAAVDRVCALETDSSVGPGFAQPGRPVIIHCIAYGAIFEPTASGPDRDNAIALLQTVSSKGGTVFPGAPNYHNDPNEGYKYAIGTLDERREKLRTAISKISNNSVGVTLVQ